MSNDIVLKTHTFLDNITASGATAWIPIDYKYSGTQNRSISGFRADINCPIKLLTKTVIQNFDSNGNKTTTTEVTATATVWDVSGRNYFSGALILPATHVQIVKVNSSGAATVVGII
jgi:hypothetical protein